MLVVSLDICIRPADLSFHLASGCVQRYLNTDLAASPPPFVAKLRTHQRHCVRYLSVRISTQPVLACCWAV